ncbi:hypothetical protein [Deinococcus ruber]|uniref:hypothetical protein n=1 Tax=Deinococcus ruber TaxID=1848197 RepID=UPI0016642DA6|nr:hypothetical protein [Deinococcus ruber]
MIPRAFWSGLSALLLTSCFLYPATPPSQDDGPQPGVESVVTHRQDGTLLINGHPYFPFGFYHISWAASGTQQQRQQDVAKLGAAGFNLLVTEPLSDQDISQYRNFLNTALNSGVYVVTYGLPAAVISQVVHEPSVIGFKIADDGNALFTPAQIKARNVTSKKLAPDKLTYISLSVGYGRPESQYFGVSDVVGNQSYPVGDDNINVVYNVMRSTVTTALAHNTVPIANLQTFAWHPGQPLPSSQELDNMTYQALMAGVKGVVYYAYRSAEVDLNKQPQLWSALQQLSREVEVLSPSLLNSRRTELADGRANRPLVVSFSGATGEYVIALNNSRSEQRQVNVALTPGRRQGQTLRPVFGTQAAITLAGGAVQGTLAPLEVAVYRVVGPGSP